MPVAIDVTGCQEDIEAIFGLAQKQSDVSDVSNPTSLDASRPLNVGLPNVSPGEVLSFVTLVFTTGKAALEFLKLLREQMKVKGATVAVSDSSTGKLLGRIEPMTSDHALSQLAPQ